MYHRGYDYDPVDNADPVKKACTPENAVRRIVNELENTDRIANLDLIIDYVADKAKRKKNGTLFKGRRVEIPGEERPDFLPLSFFARNVGDRVIDLYL